MKAAELASYRLDHLGMVATMADEIGLVDIIDSLAGVDKNEIVTTGQATLAMVVNCLGFVSRPLYITPQFFQSKLVHFLIGKCKTGKKIELATISFNKCGPYPPASFCHHHRFFHLQAPYSKPCRNLCYYVSRPRYQTR